MTSDARVFSCSTKKYWHNNCPYIVNFTVYVSTIYNVVVLHSFWEICGMSCKEKLWVRARRGTVIQPVLIQKDDSDESEESEEEGELDRPSWSTPHVREPLIGSI